MTTELRDAIEALPHEGDLGTEDLWNLPDEGSIETLAGTFIGMGSSERDRHEPHQSDYAAKGDRCSACRWVELRLFRLRGGDYALHKAGRSIVPGEVTLCRVELLSGPNEVLEALIKRDRRPGRRAAYLPMASAKLLGQASDRDRRLRVAYLDRAEAL